MIEAVKFQPEIEFLQWGVTGFEMRCEKMLALTQYENLIASGGFDS